MGAALGRQAHHLVGIRTIPVIVKVDLDRRDLSQTSKINCTPHGRSVNMDVNDRDAFAVDITDWNMSNVNARMETATFVRVKIAHVPRVANFISLHNANVLQGSIVFGMLVSWIAFHNMVVLDMSGRMMGDMGKTFGHWPDGRHMVLNGGGRHDPNMLPIGNAIAHVYRTGNGHIARPVGNGVIGGNMLDQVP